MVLEEDLEVEKKEILRKYRRLLRKAKPFLKKGDTKEIKKAFTLSMEAHADMRRKTGEPYIYHPLEVAEICVDEIGLGTTSVVCALLHDVVEDTEITLQEIESEFGSKVSKIIDGLTKIAGVFDQGSSEQAENFRKMLLTLSDDVRVILIKLADRLHNMRTLDGMPRHKQLKIANETIFLYAPLAHRLGLYNIKTELEDLFLKFTDFESYSMIEEKIRFSKDIRNRFIRQFIRPIKDEIKNLGYDFEIRSRPKSVYSIWNKMRRQNVSFEEVYDLFAIRIILNTDLEKEKAACWQVYSIVTDFYQPNPDRLRDWISTPRANGYESLHTTVMSSKGQWVEVQIRTKRMDEIAERGYAAHWKYKDSKNADSDVGLEMWINKVREILEQDKSSALEFIDDFRLNFFQEEVFVFTPKGDLVTLPAGATALDFAFDIHTEIGYHCLGAKVNQSLVPLNHQLRNGDQVEILTSKKQRPNESWIEYVVSSKAKSAIKGALKEERKAIEEMGKEIIQRKLNQLKKPLNSNEISKLCEYFNLKSGSDLYYLVGTGKIEHNQIKQYYKKVNNTNKTEVKKKPSHPKEVQENLKQVRGKDYDLLLLGEDMNILEYKFAKCCNPIPGDDVFGFVTVSDGIKIHRTTCPNAAELLSQYGYRIIKAKWASSQDTFEVSVKLIGTDRIGLINDVSTVISEELKVNMRSMSINTEGGIFEGEIHLYINDTSHLDTLITKLENVEGMMNVSRIF